MTALFIVNIHVEAVADGYFPSTMMMVCFYTVFYVNPSIIITLAFTSIITELSCALSLFDIQGKVIHAKLQLIFLQA